MRPSIGSTARLATMIILPSMSGGAASALTLDECFSIAAANSERLARGIESINQAEQDFRAARAVMLPTISAGSTFLRQDSPRSALAQNISPEEQRSSQLTLTQPLFDGLRSISALRVKRAQGEASEAAMKAAYLALYSDTARLFYSVLKSESDLRNYHKEIATHERRGAELRERRRVGRGREADEVLVLATIATLRAAEAASRRSLRADREALLFLTGSEELPELDAGPPADARYAAHQIAPSAVAVNPEVIRVERLWKAARDDAARTRGERLPTVDLRANYYIQRPGVNAESVWDAQVNASMPVFGGGAASARIRKAESLAREAELAYAETRQRVMRDERGARAVHEERALAAERSAEALRLHERYYALLLADNHAGIATNLEVLTALLAVEQARRAHDRDALDVRQSGAELRAVMADPAIYSLVHEVRLHAR